MDHNRELDKNIAKAIGYYVMQVQGTHYFCLMKPHRRTTALGSLRDDGPKRLVSERLLAVFLLAKKMLGNGFPILAPIRHTQMN